MRVVIAGLLSTVLLIGSTGCSRNTADRSPQGDVDVTAAAARAQQDIAHYAVSSAPLPSSGRSPHMTAAPIDTMPEAARRVVERYFALIARHEYRAARDLWVGDGKASGLDERTFAASFGRYPRYRAQVGIPGLVGAGMKQVHVAVPVDVSGMAEKGRTVDADGYVMLHRVNDGIRTMDPEDHLWRIRYSSVEPGMPPTSHAR